MKKCESCGLKFGEVEMNMFGYGILFGLCSRCELLKNYTNEQLLGAIRTRLKIAKNKTREVL